jgi:oligosaccharide repeat unit polymerase
MITNLIFILISTIFFYFIFFKKFVAFGFKESFSIGLLFYIYLPLFFIHYYNEFLINTYPKFNGYELIDILKIKYLTLLSMLSFMIGYISINKKINFFTSRQNYSNKNIFFSIFFLLFLSLFIQIPNINTVILISILFNLIIHKLKIKLFQKTLLFLFLCLLFMYLSLEFSDARRHIIVILFISIFFISLNYKSKIKVYFIFILITILGILFVFLLTSLRSILISGGDINLFPSLAALISNYDFMPAFDNLIYIFNSEEYLHGKSLFKIFFSIIPREIWPNKPLDTNLLIVNLRDKDFVFVGGTSQSITLLGEVFWNYGWLGTFIIFFLFGIFAKNSDLSFKHKIFDSHIILLASLTYLIFIMWRGSVSTTLIIYLINIFLLFLLLNIFKLFLKFKF